MGDSGLLLSLHSHPAGTIYNDERRRERSEWFVYSCCLIDFAEWRFAFRISVKESSGRH